MEQSEVNSREECIKEKDEGDNGGEREYLPY
jgi:hypothetical protein